MLLAHASCPPSSEVDCRVFSMVKDHLLTLAHLFGTVCLKHSATLILPPLLKPPSRRTCSITISKLFFTAVLIPSSNAQVCVCVCLSVASVVVKRPALPPCAVDGHSTNPLYYYYMQFFCTPFTKCSYFTKKKTHNGNEVIFEQGRSPRLCAHLIQFDSTQSQQDSIVQRHVRTFNFETPFSVWPSVVNGHSENLHNWRIHVTVSVF